MEILFLIGLSLIFVGIILIILSIILQNKRDVKSESGFVIVIWPFFVIGGNERIVPILVILTIVLIFLLFIMKIL